VDTSEQKWAPSCYPIPGILKETLAPRSGRGMFIYARLAIFDAM
jgi:hypothetical protein